MKLENVGEVQEYFSKKIYDNIVLNNKELNNREPVLKSYPIRIYVEPTQRCNLNCIMCDRRRSPFNEDMPMSMFYRIEKELFPYAAEVDFYMNGESFLCKDLDKMISVSCKYLFTPKLFTNLSIMNDYYSRLLVDAGVFLNLSLDAVTPELYETIRRGAKYDVFVRNLNLLQETQAKISNDKFHIRLSSTMGSYNVHESLKIIEFAEKHGIKEVQFGAMDYGKASVVHLTYDAKKAAFYFNEAKRRADEYKIRFSCPKRIGNYLIEKNHNWDDFSLPVDDYWLFDIEGNNPFDNDCGYPWTQTVIRSNGDVVSCCQRHHVMGNINNNSFMDIWNGAKYQQLRSQKDYSNCLGETCNMCHYSIWPYQINR